VFPEQEGYHLSEQKYQLKYMSAKDTCNFIRVERPQGMTTERLLQQGLIVHVDSVVVDIRIFPAKYGRREIVNLARYLRTFSHSEKGTRDKDVLKQRDWLNKRLRVLRKSDNDVSGGNCDTIDSSFS
jgi:hypothetical protein